MRILVIGGAGFIGSNFVHYWHSKHSKDQIIILDKLTYAGHLSNLSDVIKKPQIKFIKGDVCDFKVVRKVMAGVEIVVHFAAESHVDRSITGPLIFTQTNVVGTHILLEEARKANIRLFHHVSTDEVFGSLPLNNQSRFNENTSYHPNSPYSASKAASDHLVRAYYETYGLSVTLTNTSNNYGPYHDPEKLIPKFITNLLLNQKVPLMGNGENVRDWIYVEDHCRGIETVIRNALKDKALIGQSFCIGGNAEKTNLEVTKAILKLLNKDESFIEKIEHRLGHDARYAIDSSKIKKVLGWKPKYSFDQGLKKTVSWYKKNQDWWMPIKLK